MNAIALPRIDTAPQLNLPDVANLAVQVESRLGYRQLGIGLSGIKFFDVLRELDWMPFVPANVEEYKRRALRKAAGLNVFNPFHKLRWRTCELSAYRLPVPVDVLEKAISLKKKLGDLPTRVDFRITYLGTVDFDRERKMELKRLDPFLCVRHNGVMHHIEVWDEPTFNPKRSK